MQNSNEKTYVKVHYSERERAKKCGARWDADSKKWYVKGNVELFLLKFTGGTKLQRDLFNLQEKLKDVFKSINHNENEDIGIYSSKTHKRLRKEADTISEKIKIIEKQIKDDYDVQHYIDLLEADQDETVTKKKSKNEFSMLDFFNKPEETGLTALDVNIEVKHHYVYGISQGIHTEYYENGNIKLKENYVDGKKHGEHICYDEHTGEIIHKRNYGDGYM